MYVKPVVVGPIGSGWRNDIPQTAEQISNTGDGAPTMGSCCAKSKSMGSL